MKTINQNSKWGVRSASFWMTLLVAAGIVFVGARFIVSPQVSASGFGIPFSNGADIGFGRVKGIRDIFSGLALFPLLFRYAKSRCVGIYCGHYYTGYGLSDPFGDQWPIGYSTPADPWPYCSVYGNNQLSSFQR